MTGLLRARIPLVLREVCHRIESREEGILAEVAQPGDPPVPDWRELSDVATDARALALRRLLEAWEREQSTPIPFIPKPLKGD